MTDRPTPDAAQLDRRRFLRTAGAGAAITGAVWAAPQIVSVPAAAAATAGAPPVFVSRRTAAVGGPATCSNDSVTVDAPPNMLAGDLIIAFVTSQSNSTVTSSGFASAGTAAESSGFGVDTVRTTVLTKVATGGEPATYTIDRSSPGFICLPRTLRVVVAAYRGTSGINVLQSLVSPGSATSPQIFPSVTTGVVNTTVLRVAGATFRTLGAPSWGTPSVGTERIDTGAQRAIVWADADQATAGASGTATVTQAPSWYGVTWTIALAPIFS